MKFIKVILTILTFCYLCDCENVEEIFEFDRISSIFHRNFSNFNFTSSRCSLDILDTFNSFMNKEEWALTMIDASAKIQSGILLGNVINLGSFDECLSVKGVTSSNNQIKGKYCFLFTFFNFLPKPPMTYGVSPALQKVLNSNPGVPLINAVCVPNSCYEKDLKEILEFPLLAEALEINTVASDSLCQPLDNFYEFSIYHWFTLALFVINLILIIFCTALELYLLKTGEKPRHKIMLSFSLYKNIKKLYSVRKDPDQLSCINGIRIISIMWIVLGHKYLITAPYPHINYLYIFTDWLKQTSTSLIYGANYAVNTFLFLSGLLIIYVSFLARDKEIKFKIRHYYLHRFLRLSPAFYMMILFYLTFLRYTNSGPVWPIIFDTFENPCTENAWYSIFYVQNVLKMDNICVQQSWYLAIDTQLYFLAPFLFFTLRKYPKQTIALMIILIIISNIFGFAFMWIKNIPGEIISIGPDFSILHNSILYRCSAWLIGAILGYFLFMNRGKHIKINKIVVILLWSLSIFTMIFLIYMYSFFYQYQYSKFISSAYYGFSITIWSLALAWVIFACIHGYGGFINSFLSMKLFMIAGRLTYSIYIIHIAVIAATLKGKTSTSFSNLTIIQEYLSNSVIIIIVAHYWTLAFESPMIAIGECLMPKEYLKKIQEIHEENENQLNTYISRL